MSKKGRRHRARERALQILYASEYTGRLEGKRLEELWEMLEGTSIQKREPRMFNFAMELVRDVWDHKQDIDALIKRASLNWRLERMTIIDRNILRMACAELLYMDDIPVKVTIDEAVELAKTFGDRDSGGFINGILDRIKDEVDKDI